MGPVRAVLCDLDGTLLDTLGDIAQAANGVLQSLGFPPHPVQDYRRFVGEGVQVLFSRALPAGTGDPDRLALCVARFREEYARCWDVHTRPYDGIPELLTGLEERGLALAILSNKPVDFVRMYVARYLSCWTFRVVLGQGEGNPRKPDPAGALRTTAELGLASSEIVYLGDSPVDVQTAHAAGMYAVGAGWGFRPVEELRQAGADATIAHPRELLPILDARRPEREHLC